MWETLRDLPWHIIGPTLGLGITIGGFVASVYFNRKNLARGRPRVRAYIDGISKKVTGKRMLHLGITARNEPAVLDRVTVWLWWKRDRPFLGVIAEKKERIRLNDVQDREVGLERPTFIHVPLPDNEEKPVGVALEIRYYDAPESSRWTEYISRGPNVIR